MIYDAIMTYKHMIWYHIESPRLIKDIKASQWWVLISWRTNFLYCRRFGLFSKMSKGMICFRNIQMCITIAEFTAEGQHLQKGIKTD